MARSPWSATHSGRRSQPSERRWFTGFLVAALTLALWYAWARWAAGFDWTRLSDVGVIGAAAVTVLLLLILPGLPAVIWAAQRQGQARRLALLGGVLSYVTLVTVSLWLVR